MLVLKCEDFFERTIDATKLVRDFHGLPHRYLDLRSRINLPSQACRLRTRYLPVTLVRMPLILLSSLQLLKLISWLASWRLRARSSSSSFTLR